MTIEMISFLFGCLLLLAGLLGGGFQIREISFPSIKGVPRAACIVAGVVFMGLGFGNGVQTGIANPSSPISENTPSPVQFRIFDELGEGQVSEQVNVIIDDQEVGTITVSAAHPNSDLLVTVPYEGRHSYMVAANALVLNEDGSSVNYEGVGSGFVNVTQGKQFSLQGAYSGDSWAVSLVEAP
jgi:hypothetical protein